VKFYTITTHCTLHVGHKNMPVQIRLYNYGLSLFLASERNIVLQL